MGKKRVKNKKLRKSTLMIWYELQERLAYDALEKDKLDVYELYKLADLCITKLEAACVIIDEVRKILDIDDRMMMEEMILNMLVKVKNYEKTGAKGQRAMDD